MAVLVPLAGNLFLNTLPNSDDAEARVAAFLHAHQGKEAGGWLTTKVGQAVLAVKDERFLSHHGIDTLGLLRAAWNTLTRQGVEGGSTITQQLAKAVSVTDEHTLATKFPLMGVAIKREQRYSTAQILDMYLNSIYFGDGQLGIAQASQIFFGKAPQALDWAEARRLPGLPQAPSSSDPTRHWTQARLRQRHVLDRMPRNRGALPGGCSLPGTDPPGSVKRSPHVVVNAVMVCPGVGFKQLLPLLAVQPALHLHFMFAWYSTDDTHEPGVLNRPFGDEVRAWKNLAERGLRWM